MLQGRLKPGRMLLVDTVDHVIIRDEELKLRIACSQPYSTWLKHLVTLDDLRSSLLQPGRQSLQPTPALSESNPPDPQLSPAGCDAAARPIGTSAEALPYHLSPDYDVKKQLLLFNYTLETLTLLLVPMFSSKYEC